MATSMLARQLSLSACLAVMLCFVSGCEPRHVEVPFQTVEGGTPDGQIFRKLEILGVINTTSFTGNRPNAKERLFSSKFLAEVPVGTQVIIPALRSWRLGYGELKLDGNTILMKTVDHHYGAGLVRVFVEKLNPPNQTTNPVSQTALIAVEFDLTDRNLDDEWYGAIQYTLICLGVAGAPTDTRDTPWVPLEPDPPQFAVINP